MKYKILKGTKLFEQLKELETKIDHANSSAQDA
jgi:hypothetical protein